MENWDWSAIIAGIAVLISLWALKVQRGDVDRQNKYQRNTFELQHRIKEDTKLFDIASDIAATVGSLALTKDILYVQTLKKKKSWEKNVKGMGARAGGATIYADMVEIQYTESNSKLKNLENKNKLLEEQLLNQVSKIRINIATLNSEVEKSIISINSEIIDELNDMENSFKKLEALESVNQELIENSKHWAKDHHQKLRKKVLELQQIFIDMKKETFIEVKKITNDENN